MVRAHYLSTVQGYSTPRPQEACSCAAHHPHRSEEAQPYPCTRRLTPVPGVTLSLAPLSQVHLVHPIPGRGVPGPHGEPPELPDHDRGPYEDGDGQCIPPRRGNVTLTNPKPNTKMDTSEAYASFATPGLGRSRCRPGCRELRPPSADCNLAAPLIAGHCCCRGDEHVHRRDEALQAILTPTTPLVNPSLCHWPNAPMGPVMHGSLASGGPTLLHRATLPGLPPREILRVPCLRQVCDVTLILTLRRKKFFVSSNVHPQTIAVTRSSCQP